MDSAFCRDMARAYLALADRLDAGQTGSAVAILDPAGPAPVGGLEAALAKVRGHRQRQVLEVVAAGGEDGANTGQISRTIHYDQPNVYNTLHELKTKGLVELIEGSNPQHWRLAI